MTNDKMLTACKKAAPDFAIDRATEGRQRLGEKARTVEVVAATWGGVRLSLALDGRDYDEVFEEVLRGAYERLKPPVVVPSP